MSTTKLRFWIEAVERDGELEILVKKIKKEQEDIWFCFDERNQCRDGSYNVETIVANTLARKLEVEEYSGHCGRTDNNREKTC
ncbi:hypothetical protein O3M35_011790 [Rhynocoris fuscipes]|uniref:Uncharacterized protein n=1 Tax=Rhynocoris fuscipes TaxID=488301 RepID=A0AAW1CXY3_9HEMI